MFFGGLFKRQTQREPAGEKEKHASCQFLFCWLIIPGFYFQNYNNPQIFTKKRSQSSKYKLCKN